MKFLKSMGLALLVLLASNFLNLAQDDRLDKDEGDQEKPTQTASTTSYPKVENLDEDTREKIENLLKQGEKFTAERDRINQEGQRLANSGNITEAAKRQDEARKKQLESDQSFQEALDAIVQWMKDQGINIPKPVEVGDIETIEEGTSGEGNLGGAVARNQVFISEKDLAERSVGFIITSIMHQLQRCGVEQESQSDADSENADESQQEQAEPKGLSLSKATKLNPTRPGEVIEWSITITNNDSTDVEDVVIRDPLPPSVTWEDSNVDEEIGGCDSEVVCTIKRIGAGDSVTVIIRARVNADFRGDTISNTATVSTRNNEEKANTTVDTAVDTPCRQLKAYLEDLKLDNLNNTKLSKEEKQRLLAELKALYKRLTAEDREACPATAALAELITTDPRKQIDILSTESSSSDDTTTTDSSEAKEPETQDEVTEDPDTPKVRTEPFESPEFTTPDLPKTKDLVDKKTNPYWRVKKKTLKRSEQQQGNGGGTITQTLNCKTEDGEAEIECMIEYKAQVSTYPIVDQQNNQKVTDLAYHWEIVGSFNPPSKECTYDIVVTETISQPNGFSDSRKIRATGGGTFSVSSGWTTTRRSTSGTFFSNTKDITVELALTIENLECVNCEPKKRNITLTAPSDTFPKITYRQGVKLKDSNRTVSDPAGTDDQSFLDPAKILDPRGDLATKFTKTLLGIEDQETYGYLDILNIEGSIRSVDANRTALSTQQSVALEEPSTGQPQRVVVENIQSTFLELELGVRKPIPTTIDSELTVYIFIIDADGDADTGAPDSLIPDVGGDFSVSVFPATSGLSEFASLSVWNPESQGFERFNELVAFSFEQDRTSIRVTIDLDGVVDQLSQISDVAFDREVYDLAVFSWEMNNAFSGRLPPPRNEGIADFAPDFHYQPTASEFTEIPPLPESPTLKVPDNFATIDDAILAAAPGDTILIGPGIYRGDFVIDIPVTLKAERPGTVTLQGTREGALFIVDTNDVVIEGITVTGAGDGVFIQDSNNITLRNITVQRNGRLGVFVIGSRNVTIENSRILDHPDRGFFAEDSQNIVLEGNTILNNTIAGIEVRNVTITIRNNRVSNTQFAPTPEFADGIVILDGSNVTLTNNAIQNNGTCGVFGENSTITGSGNTLSGNGDGNLCGDVPNL